MSEWRPPLWLVVLLAVLLAAAPTEFTFFPAASQIGQSWRIFIGASWFLGAVGVGVLAELRSRRVDALLEDGNMRRVGRVKRAAIPILEALLSPRTGAMPENFNWTVYLLGDHDRLFPLFPAFSGEDSSPYVFDVGSGAVGQCYALNKLVVAYGDDVSNDAFALSMSQQDTFAPYKAVVGAPLRDFAGQPIGALTGVSVELDRHFEVRKTAGALQDLADTVATVLILGLMPDTGS